MDRKINEEIWIPIADAIWKSLDQGILPINKHNYSLLQNLQHQFNLNKSYLTNALLIYFFKNKLDQKYDSDLAKFETWLNQVIFRFLSSLWRNLQRAKKKDVLYQAFPIHPTCCQADASEEDLPMFDWSAYETDTPETIFLTKERQTIINNLFDEIDQQVFYNEISMAEGAKLKKKTYQAYWQEIDRKKKQLRKMLEE
jgi:hypothetical protein